MEKQYLHRFKTMMSNLSKNLTFSTKTTINSEELIQKIAVNEDLYLLDVREPDELLESKIDGVIIISLSKIFQPRAID